MKQDDDVTRDALGLPYTPRPLPQRPARDLLAGAAYRSSADTDLRRTFARIKREQKRALVAEYIPAPKPAQLLPFTPTRKVRNA